MVATTYEVQVLQGDRWRIHAQYPEDGDKDAIGEAKTLQSMPGIAGIKVVSDSYDDRTGLHNEKIIYKHTPQKRASPPSHQARARAGGDNQNFSINEQNTKKPSTFVGLIIKMMMMVLFSIAISAAFSGMLSSFLPTNIGSYHLIGTVRGNLIIIAAIVFFFISLIALFATFMKNERLKRAASKPHRKNRPAQRARPATKKKVASPSRSKPKKEKAKLTTDEEKSLRKQAGEKLKRAAEEKAKGTAEEKTKGADENLQELLAIAAEDNATEAQEEPKDDGKEKAADEFTSSSPMVGQQKAVLMGFVNNAINTLPADSKKMDNYNRFGLNLYLAGAAEALGGERNLDGETITEVLSESLQTMGLKDDHAMAFARRYEDYLLQDARYMEIFQAGRQGLSSHLSGDPNTVQALDGVMHEWNKPKKPEDPEKEVVVMFTDIVGSTAMTHDKGNMAAQKVVRAHNTVVRDALAKTGGKEIKHTGDGIMASFESVNKSLLATQQMQIMIGLHNEQLPDIPLKVKIGVNAGRVVMEEQDLYGVTVQLAARIVDKAQADQIFVSDIVHGMAQGGNWRFVKRGPYYLKGIDGPAYLQELIWDDKVDTDTVNAQANAERPQLEQKYVTASGLALPGTATAESIAPEPTAPEPTAPEPTAPEPTAPEPATA